MRNLHFQKWNQYFQMWNQYFQRWNYYFIYGVFIWPTSNLKSRVYIFIVLLFLFVDHLSFHPSVIAVIFDIPERLYRSLKNQFAAAARVFKQSIKLQLNHCILYAKAKSICIISHFHHHFPVLALPFPPFPLPFTLLSELHLYIQCHSKSLHVFIPAFGI